MKNKFKRLIITSLIGLFSSIVYCFIEIMARGYTHYSMAILAFICGIGLMFLNDTVLEYDTYFEIQVLFGTLLCTTLEYIFGLMFNSNFSVWDYRNLPFTLHFLDDQVNIMFCFAWMLICIFGIPLLDYLQYKAGLGDKPHYRFLIKTKMK